MDQEEVDRRIARLKGGSSVRQEPLTAKNTVRAEPLTPEQQELARAAWTDEERRAYEAHVITRYGIGTQAFNHGGRESVDWLRERRGLPPLAPLPPPPPMIWEKNQYGGMRGPHDNDDTSNDGFQRPGSRR